MSGYYLVSREDVSDERWDDDTSGGDFVEASWSADSYTAGYRIEDAVRWSLGQDGESLSDTDAAALLADTLAGMSPEEAENFLKTLGGIAQAALPVLGGAIGSFVAPGVGTALGATLGQAAGGLIGRATQGGGSRPRPSPTPRPAPWSPQPAAVQRGGGSVAPMSALNTLMGLLNDPQLLGAVANAAMGGKGSAPGSGAPFGAIMNALRSVAGEAAAEMHDSYAVESALDDSADNAETLVRIVGSVGAAAPTAAGGVPL